MRILFLLFIVSLTLSGCAPDHINHKVRFYGHVEDKFTHYPVTFAGITISMDWGNFGGSTSTSKLENVGTTDANGDYDFKTKKVIKDEDAYNCMLLFSGRGFSYYLYSNQWEFSTIDKCENHIDVKLYTACRIAYTFKNTSPVNSSDLVSDIYIERPWGQQEFAEGVPALAGINVDSTIWTTYYGYTTSVIHYTVTKNAVSTNYTDTVFTPDAFAGEIFLDTIAY